MLCDMAGDAPEPTAGTVCEALGVCRSRVRGSRRPSFGLVTVAGQTAGERLEGTRG
jgi:hypothetical protein